MLIQKKQILFACGSIWLLSGCGLKGPLYQTPQQSPAQNQSKPAAQFPAAPTPKTEPKTGQ